MSNMRKHKRYLIIANFIVMSITMPLITERVYAGDINSNEESVLAVIDGGFEYNGTKYRASPQYRNQAYSYFIQDGVNLTSEQANKAISEIYSNVAEGAAKGYVIPEQESPTATGETTSSEREDTSKSSESTKATQESTTSDKDTTIDDKESKPQKDTQSDEKNSDSKKIKNETDREQQTTVSVVNTHTEKDSNNGSVKVVNDNGETLYSSKGIIKNTGSHIKIDYALIISCAIILLIVSLILWKNVEKKHGRKARGIKNVILTASITIIVECVIYIAGGEISRDITAKLHKAAVIGAPDMEYVDGINVLDNKHSDKTIQKISVGTKYGIICCRDRGFEVPLYLGDDDEILKKGAGQYTESVMPGETGTTLVSAHDTTYFDKLKDLEKNDIVEINTQYGTFQYVVDKTEIKKVSDIKDYTGGSTDTQLVMYTCYPFGEIMHEREQRYLVYCSLVGGADHE